MANDRQAEMAENHQLIFEKLFEILKSAASYFVYEEKLDPANAFVFCLDLDSFWIDCFKGIPVIRKDEQIPENVYFLHTGSITLAGVLKLLSSLTPTKFIDKITEYDGDGSVRCLIFNDYGISLFNVQPEPLSFN